MLVLSLVVESPLDSPGFPLLHMQDSVEKSGFPGDFLHTNSV